MPVRTTAIAEAILHTVAAIPRGETASYGEVAARAAYPGYARYVGKVLGELPVDTNIPWHRVINAKGSSSFSPESESYREQLRRLREEGVSLL